jgi:hypothetical protein
MSKPAQHGMHEFDDDGNGFCAECELPAQNRRHPQHPGDGDPKPSGTTPLPEAPLPPLDAAGPTTGKDHPQTSLAAAYRVTEIGRMKDDILRAIADKRGHGLTDAELEEALGQSSTPAFHQTVSARRRELVQAGYLTNLIDDDGDKVTRTVGRHRAAQVWVLTPAAERLYSSAEVRF